MMWWLTLKQQPQATLQQSNRQDNQDVLPWSNLTDRGHIHIQTFLMSDQWRNLTSHKETQVDDWYVMQYHKDTLTLKNRLHTCYRKMYMYTQ